MRCLKLCVLLLVVFVETQAQFVKFRDPLFAKSIAQQYPEIMSSDSLSLDTVKAALISTKVAVTQKKIIDAHEVKYFKKIVLLQLIGNNLTEMPDFTNLSLINAVDIRTNPWVKISQLEPLKSRVQILLLRGSGGVKVKNFAFLNSYAKLKRIEITNFSAEILPDFNTFSGLTEVSVYNNKLTFKELLKLKMIPNFDTVVTAFPQLKLTKDTIISIYKNKSFTLSFPIDTGVKSTTITYDFYQNNILLQSSSSYQLKISNFSSKDTGQYYVQVKSSEPLFAGKFLSSGFFTLKVQPCSVVSLVEVGLKEGCELIPVEIKSIENNVNYPLAILSLVEKNKNKSFEFKLNTPHEIHVGMYDLYLKDTNRCETFKENFIKLEQAKDCNAFFSPNGDGFADDFFVHGNGLAMIRNKAGQIMKEIHAPGYWDGTDKNGIQAEVGIYIIEFPNGERRKMSLLR